MSDLQISPYICKVFAIVILKFDYTRIYSKYYTKLVPSSVLKTPLGDLDQIKTQIEFEEELATKSQKLMNSKPLKSTDTEIFSYGSFNVIFKLLNDVLIYVIGEFDENEAVILQVMNTIYESLNFFCRKQINKKSILENFDNLILLIDEIVDEGIILSLDPNVVISRASMKLTETTPTANETSSGQSTFSSVFASAKNQISKTLNLN